MPEIDQNVYVNNALSSSNHYCHSELRQVAPRKARYLRTYFDRFQVLIIICGSCDKCSRYTMRSLVIVGEHFDVFFEVWA